MAMQPDIQYVSFYMDGSAAKKMQRRQEHQAAAPKPKRSKAKQKARRIDPVALLSLVVAVVMFITMASAYRDYKACLQKQEQMRQYIQVLQQENEQLQKTYSEGYDLDQIRDIALAIGMVPADSVENISIEVQVPQQPEQPKQMSFWEAASIFLAGLFA